MISGSSRIGAGLLVGSVWLLVLLYLGAPGWAAAGFAAVLYLQVINATMVYNAHWSVRNER